MQVVFKCIEICYSNIRNFSSSLTQARYIEKTSFQTIQGGKKFVY